MVDDRNAGRCQALAYPAGEGRRALAVEVALQSVANRFVEQDAGPARAKQNGHFARRRGDRAQVDACLRNGFVNSAAPAFGLEQVVIEIAAAHTEHTAFASAVLFPVAREVEANQRAEEACDKADGATDHA